MIRGAIEVAQKNRISGWIHATGDTVRGKLILAFVGARCVGAGTVDRFRKDLLDAQLGDGFCGFDFPIRLAGEESLGAVVVRLQHSDAALIQSASRIVGENDNSGEATAPDLGVIPPGSLSWAQDRGWLDQAEYDFLKAMHTLGAYERGLRSAKRSGETTPSRLEPDLVVRNLLSLTVLADVEVKRTTIASISELGGATSPLRKSPLGVAALWSQGRGRICVDERSHAGPREHRGVILEALPPGGIDYEFGPDRLLFIHKDCAFAAHGPAPSQGIVLLTAAARGGQVVALPSVPVRVQAAQASQVRQGQVA